MQIKPGFHIDVSDGDVSQQRIGDAAGTLTTIWFPYRHKRRGHFSVISSSGVLFFVISRAFDHSCQTNTVAVNILLQMKIIYAPLARKSRSNYIAPRPRFTCMNM